MLVIGAYLMSRFIDYEQKNTASLFADGAGAAVLAPATSEHGILTSLLKSEGQYHGYMGIYDGGAAAPITENGARTQRLEFRKKFPDDFNPDHWTRLVRTLADRLDVTPQDVDRYFFTQINVESIRETLDRLDLPHDRAHNVMDRFGYTGNACIAMGLADAVDQHVLHEGDLVFSKAFRRVGDEVTALTVPQWIGDRRLTVFFAVASLLQIAFLVLITVGVTRVLSSVLEVPMLVAMAMTIGIPLVYIMFGGASAHTLTNAAQAVIMIVVAGMLDGAVRDRLDEIQTPTLVLFGAGDKLVPNQHLHPDRTTADIAQTADDALPNAEVHLLDDAGHLLMIEQTAVFHEKLRAFLND